MYSGNIPELQTYLALLLKKKNKHKKTIINPTIANVSLHVTNVYACRSIVYFSFASHLFLNFGEHIKRLIFHTIDENAKFCHMYKRATVCDVWHILPDNMKFNYYCLFIFIVSVRLRFIRKLVTESNATK